MNDLMEFIKVQWDDIHHSRNQEWKVLALLVPVYASFFVRTLDSRIRMAIAFLGLIVCVVGLFMSLSHWIIFYNKRQIISQCEKAIGIEVDFRRTPVPVQSLIVFTYFILGTPLAGWTMWVFSGNSTTVFIVSVFVLVVGLGFSFTSAIVMRKQFSLNNPKVLRLCGKLKSMDARVLEGDFSAFPLYARMDDLCRCIQLLHGRPLKLVANKLYDDESPWDVTKWSFTKAEGSDKVTDKKLLLNPSDEFQVSFATEKSDQQPHLHEKVFDIYISSSRIEASFEKGKPRASVDNGILIIPPMVPHKVTLHGPTFVVQCAIKGGCVDGDKQIIQEDIAE